MSTYETLNFEVNDNVARITLNRPEAANGMNIEMGKDFLAVANICKNDNSIRAIILTGNGRFFCSGGDLNAFSSYGDKISSALIELTGYLHDGIAILSKVNAPVIVAVNGAAAGAGFSFAMCGDIVIAAESSSFMMAYTGVGFSPDGSASYYLPRVIGLRKTQELMFTNRRLSAGEALDWGLVTSVVPDDELQQAATELANKLAKGATQAFGAVKKLLLDTLNNTLEEQMDVESTTVAALSEGADGQEGIHAFLEKRKPVFKG